MLTKALCERCTNQFSALKWGGNHDERRWEEGKVLCPEKLDAPIRAGVNGEVNIFVNTKDAPPQWCPFFLEHVLLERAC